jgi:prepilin-type N-terminal cleavage/methylation domain-containing protein
MKKKSPLLISILKGFTLIEVIVVTSLYTILLLVITESIVNLYQANSYSIAQSYEIDQARRGLQAWLSDVREMTYAGDGTFPVAIMEPHRLGFYSDVDQEPSIEYVEYFVATTTLYKYTYKASGSPLVYNIATPYKQEILSEYVQNLAQNINTFTYFDTNGAELATSSALLTDVKYLKIKIIVNIDPISSPGEFLLQSGTTPRNLKDNL